MNNIIISPQNQIDNIIHLRGGTNFLAKKSIGGRRDKIVTQNITLILKLCSWGEIEATLIKKISNPPINTIT